jgi:hypothetical protein
MMSRNVSSRDMSPRAYIIQGYTIQGYIIQGHPIPQDTSSKDILSPRIYHPRTYHPGMYLQSHSVHSIIIKGNTARGQVYVLSRNIPSSRGISSRGGLLDISTVRYFYKVFKTILHKPIANSGINIFYNKGVNKYYL